MTIGKVDEVVEIELVNYFIKGNNELKAQIQYAINTLPDYQKEVIILRFYYDLKIREIATITKASVSTVKSRLQQGIKKLERYLADFRGGDNV